MEEDDDKEDEATQKLREKLEIFVVLTKGHRIAMRCKDFRQEKGRVNFGGASDVSASAGEEWHGCLWNSVGVRIQKKCPPVEVLLVAKHVKLVWAAEAFLEQQEKGKAKALIANSEQTGTKQAFKSKEIVDSNSNEEEEERVCVIKKIKHKHVEEPIGMSKGKETIKLQVTVALKTPMAGPLHQTLKPIVLISDTP
ncbi:hypothetical protein C0995_015792, partial [Termitomyces sp. Mi166